MKKDEKLVQEITSRDVDFARWYTDIVKKAELIEYSSVRGCCVIRPYGYAIWENIQKILDTRFKELGHENVMMPMFIPESLLQKEKDHVEGFAPEVAWVTQGGSEQLAERLCVRPTSETLFCEHYANIIHSYRDLPKLYNQWCSVVRWEKSTRPFLRTAEFLWQEGHTMHATPEEAIAETEQMLNVYADFAEGDLAIPVLRGRKTDKEKFAGAEATYTIEAMMHDGKALQSGTSHYFGDGFAKAFDITFTDRDNQLKHPHQTSWGMSTRVIGGIIMTHGDDNGLVLPPAVAPIQVVILPIAFHKNPAVLERAHALAAELKAAGIRCKVDDTDASPGWKFAEYEMKGVPLRLEIGPRDMENGVAVVVSRDNREKNTVALDELTAKLPELMEAYRARLYEKALQNREAKTTAAVTMDEVKAQSAAGNGFIKTMWCGDLACEEAMKEQAGLTSRCMPFAQEQLSDVCPVCGKPAKTMVVWGKAY
ncbi:MAG: proline--tRNA ligase [Clostridia bacterium]|nr:proline--tRNA ligase [Clostridia bacterium]